MIVTNLDLEKVNVGREAIRQRSPATLASAAFNT